MTRRVLTALLTLATALAPRAQQAAPPEVVDALTIGLEGQGWAPDQFAQPYDRLPAHAHGVVRDAVWNLGENSSGVCVRFVTASSVVSVEWALRGPFTMDHMPDTGISGVDLYARDGDAWRWCATGRVRNPVLNRSALVSRPPSGEHEYLLYLPLYNSTASVEIITQAGHPAVRAPEYPEARRRPLVFYGTSITQGGCASRPGMSYPAILGRRFDRPSVNLGFSGNGWMDLEFQPFLAEIDAAAYILDNGPNMDTDGVRERMVPFVRALRAARPETPIILVENVNFDSAWFNEDTRTSTAEKNAAIREAFDTLITEGVDNLHLISAEGLIGTDGEATVDGVHFTDLGFLRFADALEPALREVLH